MIPQRSTRTSGPILGNNSTGRLGIGLAGGLLALNQAGKTVEAMRRGEIGTAAMHGAIAYGAGMASYHTLYRTPQFSSTAGNFARFVAKNSRAMMAGGNNNLLRQSMGHNPLARGFAGGLLKFARSVR